MRRLLWMLTLVAAALTTIAAADHYTPHWSPLGVEANLPGAEVVGHSVEGRPIYMVTVGDGPVAAMFVGLQHGDEPAGREALIELAQELEPVGFSVAIIPTVNPDGFGGRFRNEAGFRGQRHNSNGVNLNRDHVELTQPETVALWRAIRRTRPAVLVDFHEMWPKHVTFMWAYPRNPAVRPSVVEDARELAFRVRDEVGRPSAFYDDWGTDDLVGNPAILLERIGEEGIVGLMVETDRSLPASERVAMHRAAMTAVINWLESRTD